MFFLLFPEKSCEDVWYYNRSVNLLYDPEVRGNTLNNVLKILRSIIQAVENISVWKRHKYDKHLRNLWLPRPSLRCRGAVWGSSWQDATTSFQNSVLWKWPGLLPKNGIWPLFNPITFASKPQQLHFLAVWIWALIKTPLRMINGTK